MFFSENGNRKTLINYTVFITTLSSTVYCKTVIDNEHFLIVERCYTVHGELKYGP
jgi:hypothetical protein